MTDPDPIAADYRSLLVKTEQESQSEFDKGVLALSGGALGLSFAFTKDIVGTTHLVHSVYLLLAWAAWTASSTSVLMSFFTSQRACRKAVRQLDAVGKVPPRPGGWLDFGTEILNIAGLALFVSHHDGHIPQSQSEPEMKKQIIANIREPDLNCAVNGQRTPLPPTTLAAAHLGRVVPEPPVSLIEPAPAPQPTITAAPATGQNPPPSST